MPANLTQQYLKAEAAYRRAATLEEELQCLQEMLRELPKHKGTDKLQSDLKQKISKLRRELQQGRDGKKASRLRIPRQGAGRVVLLGGPNAGKSQLLRSMTRATPEVAPYPFTTREPTPGMMPYEDVMVQLIDTPPVTKDVFDPVVQALVRGADLVLLLVDLGDDDGVEQLQDLLEHLGRTKTRLAANSYLDANDVGLTFTRTFLVLNKVDDPDWQDRYQLLKEFCEFDVPEFKVSTLHGQGLESLREAIFGALDIVRVYTKLPTEKAPDFEKPFTIRRGGTLLEIAELIHKDFAKTLRFAKVWGRNVHDGASVKGDYVLEDKDIVELHH